MADSLAGDSRDFWRAFFPEETWPELVAACHYEAMRGESAHTPPAPSPPNYGTAGAVRAARPRVTR